MLIIQLNPETCEPGVSTLMLAPMLICTRNRIFDNFWPMPIWLCFLFHCHASLTKCCWLGQLELRSGWVACSNVRFNLMVCEMVDLVSITFLCSNLLTLIHFYDKVYRYQRHVKRCQVCVLKWKPFAVYTNGLTHCCDP